MDRVLAIAPDQSSLEAARELLDPGDWPTLATDGTGVLWGECQGSGSQPYRLALVEADLGYRCSCPSRKFPCKHVLALTWMRADGVSFAAAEAPAWVREWLDKRSPRAASKEEGPRPTLSIPAPDTGEPLDTQSEARRAAARERNRAEREAMILDALDELDLWISDRLERGLAAFQVEAQEQCRLAARRLVDGKAGGLAARLDQLPAMLAGVPEAVRGEATIEALAGLHLIAAAYRRQSVLPVSLAADVRMTVGWAVGREALLDDATAARLHSRWRVLATVSEMQPDRLRRLETWLIGTEPSGAPRFAVLMDFLPTSVPATFSYSVGESIEAELVFYPSPVPLRALVAHQTGQAEPAAVWSAPQGGITAALEGYEAALAGRPWLGAWPMAVRDALVVPRNDGLVLCHRHGGPALPIRAREDDGVLPLASIDGVDAFGLWDGRQLDLKYAGTPLGTWSMA